MAEYLEREAAIKAIYESDHFSVRECFGWRAREIEEVLRAVPATPVPQWISIKDRLPENGEYVLCWYEYFRYGDFNAMFAAYGIGYCYNGHWGGEVANGTKARVLAWMPLPEPPKGEAE